MSPAAAAERIHARRMPILTERISWSRPRRPSRVSALTPAEHANVRMALRALRSRFGSVRTLAAALGVSDTTVWHCCGSRRPSVSLALQIARVAGVPITDVLTGRFPKSGACSRCGHVTRSPNDGKVGGDV